MLDRRKFFRKGLSELYLPYYEALCDILPPPWQPYSGHRSFEEQDDLFNKHNGTTNAKGGQSPHNYGCASDWTPFTSDGKPLWLKNTDLQWQVYIQAVEKVGLRSGSEFGDVDHNELKITVRWPSIYVVYAKYGMEGVENELRERLIK